MTRTRLFYPLFALTLAAIPLGAWARGAYELESQFRFPSPEGLGIVGPFVDSEAMPWVLGIHYENGACQFIGPFDQDDPPITTWRLPDSEEGPVPTHCLSVQPGPDGGFLVRGYIPPDLLSNDPPYGFIASLDSEFDLDWVVYDEPNLVNGIYGQPLSFVAWSPIRGRVLTFFLGFVDLGTDQINQLHGMSIADGTGIVRRTITSWGEVSTGELEGLLVLPEEGTFLVIAHANGTQMLVYDGVERISEYPGGETDWMQESVDHAQFAANGNLYLIHHPRLDQGLAGYRLTCLSQDGDIQYYTRSLARTVEVEDPEGGQPVELTLNRPVLSYVTDSTVTLVRSAQIEYVLHIYDNFNGSEMAIQPLATIDEYSPTHVTDAGRPDRLIMMSYSVDGMEVTRYVDTIAFDPDLETPGPYGGGDEPADIVETNPDAGDSEPSPHDGGTEGTGQTDRGGDGEGCGCHAAGQPVFWPFCWLVPLVLLPARRRFRAPSTTN